MSFRPESRKFSVGNFRIAALAAAVVLTALCPAHLARGQTQWSLAPSLTVAAVQDDNIFLTPDPTVEDDIVRYTPGLALDYSAEALRIFASYSQDAEYYN